MNIRRLINVLMILSVAALSIASQPVQAQSTHSEPNSSQSASAAAGADFASLLQPDGTLKVPAGAEGSYKVDGWQMALDDDGQPHFFPPSAQPAAILPDDGFWSQDFQLGAEYIGYEASSTVQSIAIYNNLVYVGGAFSQVGTVKAKNIACWNILTSQWSALGSGVDSNVFAIAADANYVYAGGVFQTVNFVSTGPLVRWDIAGQTWSGIGKFIQSDGNSPKVYAINVIGSGDVFVGGYFDHVGTLAVSNIAHWNGAVWDNMGGGVTYSNSPTAKVFALAFGSDGLYVGGVFTIAGGNPVNNLARWNGSNWYLVGGGVGPADAYIDAIATNTTDIYVGGRFTEAYDGHGGTLPVNNVAMWNASGWFTMGGGVTSTTSYVIVSALINHSGTICAGGYFDHAGGTPTSNVACWNSANWIPMRELHDLLKQGVDDSVAAMAGNSDYLFLGGWFKNAGSYAANHITAFQFNGERWNGMGDSVNRTVNAVTIADGYIYVGGSFTTAGWIPLAYVGRWDIHTHNWYIVGNGYEIGGCAGLVCTPMVDTIYVNGDDIYVGGNFLKVGSTTVNGIARFSYAQNDYQWHALGSGVACTSPCGGTVRDIVLYTGADYPAGLYVGGRFVTAGGVTVNNVALWDGIHWNALSDMTYTGTNGTVYALNPVSNWLGDYLVVGGDFTSPYAGHPYLARWNGANWLNIGAALNGPVHAIIGGFSTQLYSQPIYIGGEFTSPVPYIARLSGSNWLGVGAGVDGSVLTLAFDGTGGLYAGGDFIYSSLDTLSHIGHWDGHNWLPIGSGLNGAVNSLAVSGKRIAAGGDFTAAGGYPSYFVATWNKLPTFLPLIHK